VWLVGQWVSKIGDEIRTSVYQVLISYLGDKDLVIALTAAHSLSKCIKFLVFFNLVVINDLTFNKEYFLEFLEPCVTMIFQLLGNVVEADTKLSLLTVISLLVEQLHEKVFITNF
jgi:hypothetical protein